MAIASNIFSTLPEILKFLEFTVYVFLIFFFGGIATKGFSLRINFIFKTILLIASGLVCLFASKAFAIYIPFFEQGMFKLFQLDIFIGGLITAFLLSISYYMITLGLQKDELKEIKEQMKMLRGLLINNHIIKPITENRAMKTAEEVTDMKAESSEILEDEWHVVVKKNGRERVVIIDAITGGVKDILRGSRIGTFFSKKIRIIGVMLILSTLMFIILNFRGLPTMSESLSEMGLEPETLSNISELFKGQQYMGRNECIKAVSVLRNTKTITEAPVYTDEKVKTIIENESNSHVVVMKMIKSDGSMVVIGFTKNNKVCLVSDNTFCGCFDVIS